MTHYVSEHSTLLTHSLTQWCELNKINTKSSHLGKKNSANQQTIKLDILLILISTKGQKLNVTTIASSHVTIASLFTGMYRHLMLEANMLFFNLFNKQRETQNETKYVRFSTRNVG